MRTSPASVASRFTDALDVSDWVTVRSLLTTDCVYECRGTTTVGANEIVDSYRTIAQWVRNTFEAVHYDSRIEETVEDTVLVTFCDRMALGEQRLDFRCQQLLRVDTSGRIVHILHIDLPGEREKADRFNDACGVTRP